MTFWTRADLKKRAKHCLGIYYWPAFVVSMIGLIFSGTGSSAASTNSTTTQQAAGELTVSVTGEQVMAMFLLIMSIALLTLAIAFVVEIFIGNIFVVGVKRFFMESRAKQQSAGIGRVLWGFRCGSYGNVMKVMLFMSVKLILWTLLLVIPGIVKSYEYRMVPYILSENPDMPSKEVFALSREMMYGNKFKSFVLDLSFIGWYLLAIVVATVLVALLPSSLFLLWILRLLPVFLLMPYFNATEAELYAYLRSHSGRGDLRGYGVPEVINPDGSWSV